MRSSNEPLPGIRLYPFRMIPAYVPDLLGRLDLDLSPEQIDQLDRYLSLLLDVNQRVNLTAVRDPDLAWHRLILDSLTLLPGLNHLKAGGSVIDVGTGGGLPGIPLAITRPDLRFTLLDATGKKVRLVQGFLQALGLERAVAIQGRAEDVAHHAEHRQRYDAAVSRAVGSVAEVLEYTLPLVRVGGRVMIVKGAKAEQELAAATDALAALGAGEVAAIEGYPETVESELVIVSAIKDRPTPKSYPRSPGLPRQNPL